MHYRFDLVDQYRSAKKADDLWQKLHVDLSKFGITNIFYTVYESQQSGIQNDSLMFNSYRSSLPDDYLDVLKKISHILPGYMHCAYKTTPYLLTGPASIKKANWKKNLKILLSKLNKKGRYFLEDQITEEQWMSLYHFINQYNYLNVGVVLPIRVARNGMGGLAAYSSEVDLKVFHQLWGSCQDEIITIGSIFDEFNRSHFSDKIYPLSLKQREALTWLSAGLNTYLISKKMNISVSTVEKHIIGARKNLKARNTEQAIVRALMFGLINP